MSAHSASSSDLQIREATPADIPEILRQRRAMYEDMDYKDAAALSAMVSVTTSYIAKAMAEGSFRSWLASVDTRTVAGGAIIVSPWPAHPYDLECRRVTILNVYTDRDYRRRGIARRILQTIIAWCRREGSARVDLHASPGGRHLYESLGFEPSNEMRLKLK
jgi:GNAT superfamily N-acetyltransferase